MSTSNMYILSQRSTRHVAEFRNGWGSAPRCWDYLSEKYLGRKTSMFGDMQSVWGLHTDSRLLECEKTAMLITFDRAYIPLANLEEAGEACAQFGTLCEDGVRVNHWPAFGVALKELAGRKFNRHARGVVISATSVNDVWGWPSREQLDGAWPIYDTPAP